MREKHLKTTCSTFTPSLVTTMSNNSMFMADPDGTGASLGARPFSQRGEGEERKKVWRLLQHFRVLLECQ